MLWACLTAQERKPKDYWARASLAELFVLVNGKDSVIREYKTAVAAANKDWFALDLGVEIEGRKLSLVPLIFGTIKAAFYSLLFAIPVLVWILDEGHATWGTFAGWMVLWLTDGIDGWLARRFAWRCFT
ncbi:MAG: hypothetical protein HC788_15635 [Sphingopyxis sp.]|nr:hypothetical protein [Sphingopyxis sp.]